MKTLKNVLLFKKNELLNTYRKDFETSQLLSKIEDEQTLGAQLQKKIKELQVWNWEIGRFSQIQITKKFWLTTCHCRLALRNWRKRLRLSVLLVPRLRSRELIFPGNLRRSARGWRRLEEPLLLRLRWIRSVKLNSRSCVEILKSRPSSMKLRLLAFVRSRQTLWPSLESKSTTSSVSNRSLRKRRVNTKWRLMISPATWRLLPKQRLVILCLKNIEHVLKFFKHLDLVFLGQSWENGPHTRGPT